MQCAAAGSARMHSNVLNKDAPVAVPSSFRSLLSNCFWSFFSKLQFPSDAHVGVLPRAQQLGQAQSRDAYVTG